MILERSMHPQWLSNTYLVAAGPGGDGFFVDAGGPVAPLIEEADEHGSRSPTCCSRTTTTTTSPSSASLRRAGRTRRC
jgi:hypothetical protein